MTPTASNFAIDTSFTLDETQLAQRKAASARRLHTMQIPALRAAGFFILCVIALGQDLSHPFKPFPSPELVLLIALNLLYAAVGWVVLRTGYGRVPRVDLSLLLFHLDVLVWLPNLYHLELGHLFFAYFLLVRVVDQVGFGFRRALYFCHYVTLVYLGYSVWVAMAEPSWAHWPERASILVVLYLLGLYFAATGLVTQRLRQRSRQAIRAARSLVDTLEHKAHDLEAQAQELERARAQADDARAEAEAAMRQAEAANRAKSQFLAVTSHEIRTPMNGILGAAELLIASPLDDKQQRYVRTAHRSATALLALIDDVLDLSRIEAGRLTLQLASVDLRALLTDAVELVEMTARNKPIMLRCRVDARLPQRVMADPLRLRQLVVNLLHNAVKFTDRGSVVFELTVLAEGPESLRVRMVVRDTGIGIPAPQLTSIFDAFTQVDGSSTRRHGGSGLGLAIVKELTQLMDGEVSVESGVGQGSTFHVDMRLLKAPDDPLPNAAASLGDGEGTVSVLVAEDDPVNQMVVAEMLRMLGCEVDVVDDGDAALRDAVGGAYDLVFMDCHMPVMDGYEATRRIREREATNGSHVVIVALTADALSSDRDRCLAAGMDGFMTKPVSSSQLSSAIERWTGRRTHPATQW